MLNRILFNFQDFSISMVTQSSRRSFATVLIQRDMARIITSVEFFREFSKDYMKCLVSKNVNLALQIQK